MSYASECARKCKYSLKKAIEVKERCQLERGIKLRLYNCPWCSHIHLTHVDVDRPEPLTKNQKRAKAKKASIVKRRLAANRFIQRKLWRVLARVVTTDRKAKKLELKLFKDYEQQKQGVKRWKSKHKQRR